MKLSKLIHSRTENKGGTLNLGKSFSESLTNV